MAIKAFDAELSSRTEQVMVPRKSVEATDYKNPLNWIERLGGWAVVVFIVYWLTTKWENVMTEQIAELKHLTITISDSNRLMITNQEAILRVLTQDRNK